MSISETRYANRFSCLLMLEISAVAIYLNSGDPVAKMMRETMVGTMILSLIDDESPKPSALDVEMVLGIRGETMARNCGGVVTTCDCCDRLAWPWQLRQYDTAADVCLSPRCGEKHGLFACESCFVEASLRVHSRVLRQAHENSAPRLRRITPAKN